MSFFDKLRVLELASVLAGPSVGQFMAELGAQVIKVENPHSGGDTTRSWTVKGEQPPKPGCTAYFSSVNWGKSSIAVDLQQPEGLQIIRQLAEASDVIVASYKPGVAARLQVEDSDFRKGNDRLIYVSITGFGAKEQRAGFDALVQAETGFMAMNGWPGQPPTKMPVALMDILAGHQAKEGLLVALLERGATGKGKKVEVSLRDAAWASLANQGTNWLQAGHNPQPMGNDHPNIVPYGTVFHDKTGQPFVLAIGSDKQFTRFCAMIGQPGWAADVRFTTNAERVAHRDQLLQRIQRHLAELSFSRIYDQALAIGLPIGKVNTLAEALQDPAFKRLHLHTADGLAGIRSEVFQPSPKPLSPPPSLGQHTEEVLQALGYSARTIARLRLGKVVV